MAEEASFVYINSPAKTYESSRAIRVGSLCASKLTGRNGRVRQFVYDRLDRRSQELWLDGANVVNTIDYSYDAADRLTAASDDFSAYGYTYDHLGRPTQVDNAGTAGAPNVVLTNAYDSSGRRTELSAVIGGTADFVNSDVYDAIGRMTRITQTDGSPSQGYAIGEKRVELSYRADGRYDAITRYADLAGTQLVATTTHSYDDIGRLTALAHAHQSAGAHPA